MTEVLVVLLVVAVALYLWNTYIPLPAPVARLKMIVNAVVVLLTLWWLLRRGHG